MTGTTDKKYPGKRPGRGKRIPHYNMDEDGHDEHGAADEEEDGDNEGGDEDEDEDDDDD